MHQLSHLQVLKMQSETVFKTFKPFFALLVKQFETAWVLLKTHPADAKKDQKQDEENE